MTIVITDLLGRQVQQNNYNLIAGSNQIPMNFSKLTAGNSPTGGLHCRK
jgi:hypothetical protein